MITNNLALFGFIELEELEKTIRALREHGTPEGFDWGGIKPYFNPSSGNVFLMNDAFQVAMKNGDKLEIWHTCPECGFEGFIEDFNEENQSNECCIEYGKEL